AILDELDKVNPVTGELIPSQSDEYLSANHLWNAGDRKITLAAARNEFVAFQILLRGQIPAGSINPELTFDGPAGRALQVETGRYALVESKSGPLPDPIVPLNLPIAGHQAHVKNHGLHVEIYVPRDLPPRDYHGTLTLKRSRTVGASSRAADPGLRLAV